MLNNLNQDKTVCVVGLGYIGLPTAALLANRGYRVHGVDVNASTVDIINRGEVHIVEAGLDAFVHSAVQSGHLTASLAACKADVFVIAVPTPFHPYENGEIPKPNTDYVMSATKSIAPFLCFGNIVILESTSPVGTTDKIFSCLKDLRPELFTSESQVYVSHCPERVLPGRIMIELVENDRIIGGVDSLSTQETLAFYKTFVEGELLATDSRTAEMAKLTENASRDVGIAFANELSMICDKQGIDVRELIRLANHHPRVNILQPGTGVGGHCIAVDPWFIVSSDPENARITKLAREVNIRKTEWVIEKIKDESSKWSTSRDGRQAVVALLGLAFKPDIDDLRESPALKVAERLSIEGDCVLLVVEPNVTHLTNFNLVTIEDALSEADIVAFLVNHAPFHAICAEDLTGKIVVDACGTTYQPRMHAIGEKCL